MEEQNPWIHEYVGRTELEPTAVWSVLKDIDHWTDWDTSMESIRLRGPFAVGSTVEMTPTGQDPITSRIVEIRDQRVYADETEMNGLVLRFSHTLTPTETGGTLVTHRLEISGESARELAPEIGAMITEDFPDAMAAMLDVARQRRR